MIVAAWAVGRIEKAWVSIGSFIVTSDSLVCCIFGRDGVLRQKKGGASQTDTNDSPSRSPPQDFQPSIFHTLPKLRHRSAHCSQSPTPRSKRL